MGKKKKETDYKALYVLGITFIPLGIIFSSTVSPAFLSFFGIGIALMAIGLKNKDKWKETKKN